LRFEGHEWPMMNRPHTRRVLIGLTILALVVLSTAAVAHAHFGPHADADEAHCPLCMAVHNAKDAVVTPIVALHFAAVQMAILAPLTSSIMVFVQPPLRQDRAPPQR
jgi:hypothetical protein